MGRAGLQEARLPRGPILIRRKREPALLVGTMVVVAQTTSPDVTDSDGHYVPSLPRGVVERRGEEEPDLPESEPFPELSQGFPGGGALGYSSDWRRSPRGK